MKKIVVLGLCGLIMACNAENERGIQSLTTDSTASGIAYNNLDTMPVGVRPAAAAPVSTPAAATDSVPAATATSVPAQTTASAPASSQPAAQPAKQTAPAAVDNSADIKKGEALISKSDCLACHKVQDKLLGPSYKDVAAKYPDNAATINQLADKIKKGGSGVWGAIPMSPHPALSDDDAKAMVKYILSLR